MAQNTYDDGQVAPIVRQTRGGKTSPLVPAHLQTKQGMLGHKLMDFFGRPTKPGSRLPERNPYEGGSRARQFARGHQGISLSGRRLRGQGFTPTDRSVASSGTAILGFSGAAYAGVGPGGVPRSTGASPLF